MPSTKRRSSTHERRLSDVRVDLYSLTTADVVELLNDRKLSEPLPTFVFRYRTLFWYAQDTTLEAFTPPSPLLFSDDELDIDLTV